MTTQTDRVVATLTRADFPKAKKLRASCAEPGCPERPTERWTSDDVTNDLERTINFLRGWFREHILTTGHSIVVIEAVEDERT